MIVGGGGDNYILQYIKNIFRVPSISEFTVNGFLWTKARIKVYKLFFVNYSAKSHWQSQTNLWRYMKKHLLLAWFAASD